MTKQEVFDRFIKDIEHPNLIKAIRKSFPEYGRLRDQLIDTYSDLTGISKDEFQSQLALRLFKGLN